MLLSCEVVTYFTQRRDILSTAPAAFISSEVLFWFQLHPELRCRSSCWLRPSHNPNFLCFTRFASSNPPSQPASQQDSFIVAQVRQLFSNLSVCWGYPTFIQPAETPTGRWSLPALFRFLSIALPAHAGIRHSFHLCHEHQQSWFSPPPSIIAAVSRPNLRASLPVLREAMTIPSLRSTHAFCSCLPSPGFLFHSRFTRSDDKSKRRGRMAGFGLCCVTPAQPFALRYTPFPTVTHYAYIYTSSKGAKTVAGLGSQDNFCAICVFSLDPSSKPFSVIILVSNCNMYAPFTKRRICLLLLRYPWVTLFMNMKI